MICEWCKSDLTVGAVVCPDCGKDRKDIYENKMKTYFFISFGCMGIMGGWLSTNGYLLAGGVLLSVIGLVFAQKVSKAVRSWWWY